MKFWLLLFLCIPYLYASGQDKTLTGIVFDKSTKERIAEVNVKNTTNGQSAFNNLKGEYKIAAQPGDVLVFTKLNYFNDTVTVAGYTPLAVYMSRTAILLKQVDIKSKALTPEQQLEATKQDYTKIYGPLGNRDLLNVNSDGVGIGIDALYNIFSRSGRNAEHLQEIIQRDYYQNVVDYRFNPVFVGRITGLKDPQLKDFMQKYRPGYYFVIAASDYDFITSIKSNLKRYLRRPKAKALQPLPAEK